MQNFLFIHIQIINRLAHHYQVLILELANNIFQLIMMFKYLMKLEYIGLGFIFYLELILQVMFYSLGS